MYCSINGSSFTKCKFFKFRNKISKMLKAVLCQKASGWDIVLSLKRANLHNRTAIYLLFYKDTHLHRYYLNISNL